MKWLEIIELRSVQKYQARIEQVLAHLESGAGLWNKSWTITVYRNLSIDTDWSFHLHYQSPQKDICKSAPGLHLAAEFWIVKIFQKILGGKFAEIAIAMHARAAREEFRELDKDFKILADKAIIKTPNLDKLRVYFDIK